MRRHGCAGAWQCRSSRHLLTCAIILLCRGKHGDDEAWEGGDATNRVIVNKQSGEIVSFEAPPGFSGHGLFYWREIFQ